MSKPQEKPSALKRDNPALKKMKFTNCFKFFWSHFCRPGSGSKPDPDPQHWFVGNFFVIFVLFSQSRCPDCKQLIPDFVMDEHVEDCPGR